MKNGTTKIIDSISIAFVNYTLFFLVVGSVDLHATCTFNFEKTLIVPVSVAESSRPNLTFALLGGFINKT